jgi:penicillin-binding protein 2
VYLDRDTRHPITPQLAVRVAIIGGVALVMFAVIFFRLWYLQVLSGDKYKAEANNNRVREITVQAPRGRILDRNGKVLVDNRYGLAVTVTPDKLPKKPRAQLKIYARLGPLLHMRAKDIRHAVNKQFAAVPFSPAIVKADVPQATYSYILENQDRFPAVDVEQLAFRKYPYHEIGAHLFGTVGEVTGSASRGSSTRTTATCAARTVRGGSRSTRSATRARSSPSGCPNPAASCASGSTSTCRRRASRRSPATRPRSS